MTFFGLFDRRFKYRLSRQFVDWVKEINPDFIYSHIGSYGMAELIIKCQESFANIKFITHTYDDWVNRHGNSHNIFKRILDYKSNKILNKVISKSHICIALSEKMAQEYEKRYKKPHQTFYNTVNINHKALRNSKNDMVFNITYVGKIARYNADSIVDMIKAVDVINSSNKSKTKFNIYTPTAKLNIDKLISYKGENTIFHKPIPYDEVVKVLSKSSLLFLPITISKQNISFTKYSFSTKIAEYFAAKAPVLYYGPDNIAMSEMFIKYKCAFCLTEKNLNKLIELVLYALNNKSKSELIVNNAYSLVKEKFDIDVVSQKFYDLLNQHK